MRPAAQGAALLFAGFHFLELSCNEGFWPPTGLSTPLLLEVLVVKTALGSERPGPAPASAAVSSNSHVSVHSARPLRSHVEDIATEVPDIVGDKILGGGLRNETSCTNPPPISAREGCEPRTSQSRGEQVGGNYHLWALGIPSG